MSQSRHNEVGASFHQQFHPLADEMAVVAVRPAADEIAVHHARFVHKVATAHFQVELAFEHRGYGDDRGRDRRKRGFRQHDR